MRMNIDTYRTIAGMIICPWVLVASWSIPYMNGSAFSTWVVFNAIAAFLVFFFTAGISHAVLKAFSLVKWWHYSVVMFCVCLVIFYGFTTLAVSGYTALYHSQIQIVENGSITRAGHLLNLRSAFSGSLLSAATFFIFWLIAIWKPGVIRKKA